jgi:hypothetical protein
MIPVGFPPYRRQSRHWRESQWQNIGGIRSVPVGIKTPAGVTMGKPQRDSLHTNGNQDTGRNHDGPAGLDAIPTGMPVESRQFYVHRAK